MDVSTTSNFGALNELLKKNDATTSRPKRIQRHVSSALSNCLVVMVFEV
jgi:hypothetical protein